MINVLYVFGGEKASGAEKVIDRLITNNTARVNAHLFIAPGEFSNDLKSKSTSYKQIINIDQLKKLNRGAASTVLFYLKALGNYFIISHKVCRYISGYNIDVVHANTIVPASYLLPAIMWLKLFKRKVTFIWSDHDLKYFSGIDHKLADLCTRYYHRTLVVSDAVKNKYHGVNSNKIVTLYNGLNLSEFVNDDASREAFRKKYDLEINTTVIGLAGTIEPRKGQLSLIKVFKQLQVKFPGTKLILAGAESMDAPEYTNTVREEVKNINNINYLGRINDMLSFYNGCDIILNNSSLNGGEPLGTTIYEAMAIGKIVLASDTGGTKEIISDGNDGFIFTPDDDNALFEKLNYVIENFANLQNVAANAKLKVKAKFDVDIMTRKYNIILNDLTPYHN